MVIETEYHAKSNLINGNFKSIVRKSLQILADDNNLPSHKVCECLGMKLEGIVFNCKNLNGRIVNHVIHVIHG